MSQFVTPEEATLRWTNYADWYALKGHFWVGTGPFYLEKAYPTEKTVSSAPLPRFPRLRLPLGNLWYADDPSSRG